MVEQVCFTIHCGRRERRPWETVGRLSKRGLERNLGLKVWLGDSGEGTRREGLLWVGWYGCCPKMGKIL